MAGVTGMSTQMLFSEYKGKKTNIDLRDTSPYFRSDVLRKYPMFEGFVNAVGNTPIIEIPQSNGSAKIFAKCEFVNPWGTIKDRIALAMIWRALGEGLDPKKHRILEYSGGQLAVALAQVCASIGARATIVLSDAAPRSIISAVESCGAALDLVPAEKGFWGVMLRAMALNEEQSDFHFLYQHENAANPAMHRLGTATELLAQVPSRRIDAWVAAIGTGGTLAGVGSGLMDAMPGIALFGVTPAELSYGSDDPPNGTPKFAGSGGLGWGRKQTFVEQLEGKLVAHRSISYAAARAEMYRFLCETGLRIGSSAAANLLVAKDVAAQLGSGRIVATIFPSSGSTEEWELVERECHCD